jgi:hypothetical protein
MCTGFPSRATNTRRGAANGAVPSLSAEGFRRINDVETRT